jgi:hypothetical protein
MLNETQLMMQFVEKDPQQTSQPRSRRNNKQVLQHQKSEEQRPIGERKITLEYDDYYLEYGGYLESGYIDNFLPGNTESIIHFRQIEIMDANSLENNRGGLGVS